MSKSKVDDYGFLELSSGDDPKVDIIAVHGLDGHREDTWMTEEGILWLRAFLASDLANARILTYGYDADTSSSECVSTQTIHQQADGLAKALARIRQGASRRRPIIFIAHNLGGIILKLALVICHNQSLESKGDLRDVLVSTHAILFFGTPHSGMEGTTFLEAVNRLASVYMKTTNILLKDLRAHSAELENVQSLYLAAGEKISSVFFCEEYETPTNGKRRKLNIPHHSAVIAGDRNATAVVLHADHQNLVRFSSADSENYKTVLYYLKEYIENAPSAVRDKWIREDNHLVAKGESLAQEDVLPKPRPPVSRSYVERAEIQSLITQKLLPEAPVRHQPRCILHGLGGVGKTQLATNWIKEHESSFTRIIVVDASSQTQLEADLERSIRSMGPDYAKKTWKDAVAYLDGKEKGWLLFLDNADLPDLNLQPYLPNSSRGAILITTRNRECVEHARDGAISVGGLEEHEAVKLLHAIADMSPTSDSKALEIVKELGMLALAITQAGAYIHKTRRLNAYLDTFRKHRARLMRGLPVQTADYPFSTYTAFDLSFRQLSKKAQELMKLFAFLYHSHIPAILFEQSAASRFTTATVLEYFPPPESDKIFISYLEEILGVEWDEFSFQEMVESALRASLINISADGLFYTVHPLVQTYIKDQLDEEKNQHYTRMTVQLVLGAIAFRESSNDQRWLLLPNVNGIPRSVQAENVAHALAFNEFYDSLGDSRPCRELLESALSQIERTHDRGSEEAIQLMRLLAVAMFNCDHLDDTEKMEREVLDLRVEILGRRHLDTISAMADLATTLQKRGQLDEAEKMEREVLDLRVEILGRRHLDTISAMANLASTRYKRGRLDEAEKMEREVLDLRVEILGRRHLDTISAMADLATTLQQRGRLDEAEKMQREVLDLRVEILGRRHLDTISAMASLASTLQERGQLDEAEKMEREVLDLRVEILGRRHLDTISAMANLAGTLYTGGQLDEAEKMQREVLDLRVKIQGRRHLYTISAMANLASTLYERGQLDEAEKMQREVLDVRVEILGRRHLDTITAMADLATTLQQRGRLDEAEKMDREVLDLRVEFLGRRHLDTISAMANLATTLDERGRFDEAEKLDLEVLDLRVEILGRRHLDTITAMNNVAATMYRSVQLGDAEKMQREVLDLRLEILGRRHLDTVSAIANLANTLCVRGHLEEAEKMHREVLDLRLELLGRRHPETILAMKNLAATLKKRGWLEEAMKLQQEMLVES